MSINCLERYIMDIIELMDKLTRDRYYEKRRQLVAEGLSYALLAARFSMKNDERGIQLTLDAITKVNAKIEMLDELIGELKNAG